MIDVIVAIKIQKDKIRSPAFAISIGRNQSISDEKTETIKPVLSKKRNNTSPCQFTSRTIQKINMPGIEKISVNTNTSKKEMGHSLNSFEKKVSQVPLNIAFSKAVKTQVVKLIKIDLINIISKSTLFFKVFIQKNYFVDLIMASNAAIWALKALSPALVTEYVVLVFLPINPF